jgi:hypothetical protein
MVVSFIVNNEEHLLRSLPDTDSSSNIILQAYSSDPFIKTDGNHTTTWSTQLDYDCEIFTPRVPSQETTVFFLDILFR